MSVTLDWLIAGLPQMVTPAFVHALTDPLVVELTGPGGRTFRVVAGDGGVTVDDGDETGRGRVRSTAVDFVLWATGREPRAPRVTVAGDTGWANDALNAFRVF